MLKSETHSGENTKIFYKFNFLYKINIRKYSWTSITTISLEKSN